MNPSPLTGERLAIVLEYRHTSSLLTLTSMCCSSYLHLALMETRGSIMTAALPNSCGLSVLLVHFHTLQKRKSPTVLSAGLETKALIHRWDKINTDSGKVNSPRLKHEVFS